MIAIKVEPKRLNIILAWIVVGIWMAAILSFSSDIAEVSNLKSTFVREKLIQVLSIFERLIDLNLVYLVSDYYIRKMAHVFIYFILGFLVFCALKISKVRGWKRYLIAWGFATVFSSLDELYQRLIPGRSGEIRDVAIDNIGVVSALVLIMIFSLLRNLKWRKDVA